MNYAIVFRLLSYILLCESALLMLPAATSAIYGEWSVLGAFLITAALCVVFGLLLRLAKPTSKVFYMREGFATTALSWIVISIMGAVPFVLTGCIPDPINALFETVSGFTTTGASILPAVEGLPRGILLWRSFTHWIGGMGVLVFLLTLLPLTGGSHVNLMKAESPGPQVDKLVPKVQSTAKLLYGIYLALTLAQLVFLMAGGMPLFESLLTAFGTAGTGGFGFKNDSFAQFSPYIQWVVTIFMILFGVNFNFYFLLLLRRFRRAVSSEEVRAYLGIILVSIGIITLNIRSMYSGLGEALRHAAFQVGSIITTTGFSSCDFDLWPTLSKQLLVLLMFVGACAGSTGGGMKVSRILIFRKTVGKELKQAMHPQVVAPVRMDGKLLSHETIRTTNVYLCAYLFILVASIMLISLDGFDMVTNFTAVAATLNNIGPGLSQVGPMMNFAGFSNPAKLVLIFDMLAGRLELFPMLVLFLPSAWRKF
ncbi:MAG: TrkH family potassium uptake protein [Faecalibacterium prausnitzii]|nr:TrkH family potassium uptake protein [Faecalibacterium prausnitzii]